MTATPAICRSVGNLLAEVGGGIGSHDGYPCYLSLSTGVLPLQFRLVKMHDACVVWGIAAGDGAGHGLQQH